MLDRLSIFGHAAFAAVIIHMLPVQAAAKESCQSGVSYLVASMQEVLILMAAFVLGWHLIRPLMTLLTQRELASAPSSCKNNRRTTPSNRKTLTHPGSEKQPETIRSAVEDSLQPSSEALCREKEACEQVQTGRPDLAVDLWLARAKAALFDCEAEHVQLPEAELFVTALEACVRCGDYESACRLVRHAGWRAPSSCQGQAALLSLARWLAKRHDLVSASRCVNAVQQGGGSLDLRTLKSLIVVCAQTGHMEQGEDYFKQILAQNLLPDFALFSAMIRGFCNAGKVEEALSHLELMLDRAFRPDSLLFDALLESCARRNCLFVAERVLQVMQQTSVQPSNCTLAACIKLYTSRGEIEQALAMFEDMPKQHNFQPNSHVFSSLISAACSHERPELALKAYESMRSAGLHPNVRTYQSLVQSWLRMGNLEKAVALVEDAFWPDGPGLQSATHVRRSLLQPAIVEELLLLAGRRRKARTVGLPLLERLEGVNFEISSKVIESLLRGAAAEAADAGSKQCRRNKEFDCWRSFSVA